MLVSVDVMKDVTMAVVITAMRRLIVYHARFYVMIMIVIVAAAVMILSFRQETIQTSRARVHVAVRKHNRNFITSERESASAGSFYLLGIDIV